MAAFLTVRWELFFLVSAFLYFHFCLDTKVEQKVKDGANRSAIRRMADIATGTLRLHLLYLGHNSSYNFYQCLDRVNSPHYSYNRESAEHFLTCWEHRAA